MIAGRHLAMAAAVPVTAIAAVQAPLWTYALSLALFGLPHVLAELRYVDERFTARLLRPVRLGLALPLAAIVGLRTLAAAGTGTTWPRTAVELGLGCLLVAATLPVLRRVRQAPVAVAVLLALGGGAAVAPLDTIVVFAVLHNLTPLGLLAERLRGGERRMALWLGGVAFVVVPLLIGTGVGREWLAGWSGDWTDSGPFATGTLDRHLPVFVLPALLGTTTAIDLFAAGAYLQCMHYAVVLHVLPRLGGGGETPGALVPWPRTAPRFVLFGSGLVMAAGFAADFGATRTLYGVAAALHAWLEIPLLLLACGLAPRGDNDAVPSMRAA